MKPTDEELFNKGLTRNESRSARGVYIGREAGQFLFDLWRNGQIKGKRAAESVEIICKMSEYIKDAQKKNDVQAMAAKLLAEGESWDCINVAIQTMAARDMEAKSGKMKQGWLFFGAGFEEELKQRGRFAARSIEFLRQKIKAGEGAQRASENAEEVARQGYTVTRKEGSEEYTLEELVRLMERFKHMASDAELMRDSLEWDGESKLDPIARYLTPERKEDMEEQMRREQEEKEREAREYLEAHVDSLFGADGMGSAQMVERNEIRERAKADGSYMLAPNGRASRLTPEQWVFARTQAFKAKYGDFEMVPRFYRAMERLKEMAAVCKLTGKEFPKGDVPLVQQVYDDWAKYNHVANNPVLGAVKMDKRSIKDSIYHGLNGVKAAAFAAVHDVIEKGVYVESIANWKDRGKDSYVFAAPVAIGGTDYVCEVVIMRDANRTGFYLHYVQIKNELLDAISTGLYTGTSGAHTSILMETSKRVKQNEKKLEGKLDENGEPKAEVVTEAMEEDADTGNFSSSVRNLAAVHTLSYENFIDAGDKLGGMPLPSVAVTRLDKPYDWGSYQDVTLVARPDMVDPRRGTDVYARDAWTGRMPMIESETLADGREYRYFYDEEGEEVEATLENLTDYLYERKRRGNEATERELDLVQTAKAYLARRMRDMDDVKGQRERLQESKEVIVWSWVIGSWMNMLSERYDTWLGDEEWIGVFEALADLDEVTEGSVREAIMNWTDADGRADLSALQNSEAMEEGSRFIKETVRILNKLRAEKTDYLEAVPRRAVKMGEWAYALFSEKIPDKDEVRRVCREHGIVPVEYKAGEKKQALKDLIDDGEVSFSVIGEGAVTWGRYKGRAFKGRDDGKMRAEIDASKARLKKSGWKKYKEAEYEEKDFCKLGDLLSYPELYAAYPWMKEVPVDKQPKGKRGSTAVMPPLDRDKTGRIRLGEKENEEEARRSLLHEVQHLIQRVEHFASGAGSNDMVREIMRELGREGEYQDTNDDFVYVEGKGYVYNTQGELYMRSAGEIEARNVAQRAGMSARERRERSFNETLDRRAEDAIVYDVNDYYYSYRWNALRYHAQNERSGASPDVSAAMRRAREMELTRRVHELLIGRREEREAKAMVEAWDAWMARFKAVMAGKEGEKSRLGRGMEAMGRMVALLESTRAALPGRYRVGWLDVQLRWATWYAQMMESGEVKMSDVVKDDGLAKKYEERFRKAVERKAELGVDEQGLKEFLADMVGKRMDAILVNVAAKSRRTLERFLKDRARERMDDMALRLYPKRERGRAWPRGKADAATYRFVQEAYKQMDAKPGEKGERGDYEAETERLEGAEAPYLRFTTYDLRFGNSAATPRGDGDMSASVRDGKICTLFNRGVRRGVGEIHTPKKA